jgi:hypothetical protein
MHPEIRYVVNPVHRDGTLIGTPPKMRHDLDCGHFDWGDGAMLGTPELATPEQIRTLGACEHCVEARDKNSPGQPAGKLGHLCPTCRQVTPLTGICDNCS